MKESIDMSLQCQSHFGQLIEHTRGYMFIRINYLCRYRMVVMVKYLKKIREKINIECKKPTSHFFFFFFNQVVGLN